MSKQQSEKDKGVDKYEETEEYKKMKRIYSDANWMNRQMEMYYDIVNNPENSEISDELYCDIIMALYKITNIKEAEFVLKRIKDYVASKDGWTLRSSIRYLLLKDLEKTRKCIKKYEPVHNSKCKIGKYAGFIISKYFQCS